MSLNEAGRGRVQLQSNLPSVVSFRLLDTTYRFGWYTSYLENKFWKFLWKYQPQELLKRILHTCIQDSQGRQASQCIQRTCTACFLASKLRNTLKFQASKYQNTLKFLALKPCALPVFSLDWRPWRFRNIF